MKTLLIDFGNVIGFFDHFLGVDQLTRYSDLGRVELERAIFGGQAQDDFECGRLTTAEFTRISLDAGHLTCSGDEFVRAYCDIFTRNPEVCGLIPRLKPRYRLVLASNTNEAHYRRYLADYDDVLKLFDARCPSHHAGARKPHRAYYDYCQPFLGAEPGECLFLDDLEKNVATGREVGWRTLQYLPGQNLERKLLDLGVVLA